MNRKKERICITQLLYQHEFNIIEKDNLEQVLAEHKLENSEFARSSIISILQNIDKIDNIIKSKLNNRKLETMLPIEKAILRVSINEFLIQKSVPVSVSINEAVENTKKFSNEDSYKFINGILSAIEKDN
ncbi:transcription antitermination factor NusB [Helcococcus kunzii]|uniref:transcription antitermination factor NusB n=1 Tax=Helcococcus kunzii TaxID=40091 RepID=UPI0038A1A67B